MWHFNCSFAMCHVPLCCHLTHSCSIHLWTHMNDQNLLDQSSTFWRRLKLRASVRVMGGAYNLSTKHQFKNLTYPFKTHWIQWNRPGLKALVIRDAAVIYLYLEAVEAAVVTHHQLPVVLQWVDVAIGHQHGAKDLRFWRVQRGRQKEKLIR